MNTPVVSPHPLPPSSLLGVLILLVACVGVIDSPSEPNGPGDVRVGQDEPAPGEPDRGSSEIRRLTRAEYINAVAEVISPAMVDLVEATLRRLPADGDDRYSTEVAYGLTPSHLDSYLAVAEEVGAVLEAQPSMRGDIHACLVESPITDACWGLTVEALARRAFRRSPTDEERSSLLALMADATAEERLRGLVLAILLSPQLIYKTEFGGEAEGTLVGLTDLEVASRLSFLLWGAPPDEELLAHAESGFGEGELRSEAQRLLEDPRARAWLRHFFEEYMHLDRIQVPGNEVLLDGLVTADLPAAMGEETLEFAEFVVFDLEGTYRDLLMDRTAFVADPTLAEIYGVPPSPDGVVLPPERAGLLTRAAALAGSGNETSPIHRGAHLLERFICTTLPTPDGLPGVLPPPPDPSLTARERWTAQTDGEACSSCHSMINPFGFALEEFDTLGRHRETELIFAGTESVQNELPIDANAMLTTSDPAGVINGGVGLSEALAASPRAAHCFAEQYMQFSMGRKMDSRDAGLVDELADLLAAEGAFVDFFVHLATAPSQQLRRFPNE